jgi:hypothetical protein
MEWVLKKVEIVYFYEICIEHDEKCIIFVKFSFNCKNLFLKFRLNFIKRPCSVDQTFSVPFLENFQLSELLHYNLRGSSFYYVIFLNTCDFPKCAL